MKTHILILIFALCLIRPLQGQMLKGGGEDNPELLTNRESLEKWRDLRFGMFIHWGPVALKGTEIGWSRGREVPFAEYDELYKQFNPVKFNAEEWVSLLKEAGMKYLIIVSKHHDGFVMWDSETTEYDIMSTPYGKDVLRAVSDECRRQGILFGTYYSICDWPHPDYPVELNREGRKEGADMDRYIRYMKAQLKELVEKYHTKILWFDGEWEDPWTHEMGMDLYEYVRGLDDEILINNRVDKGRHGMEGVSLSDEYAGDFATPEQQVGKFDTLTPWESCITICRQWAWKPDDQLKSLDECLRTLVSTAGGDGNLLLNVGPKPDGTIEDRQADRLREIGDWLSVRGEAIYRTRGGPIPPQSWGVSTQKGNHVYLHLMEPVKEIRISEFPFEVIDAALLGSGSEIPYSHPGNDLVLRIPPDTKGIPVRVIKVEILD